MNLWSLFQLKQSPTLPLYKTLSPITKLLKLVEKCRSLAAHNICCPPSPSERFVQPLTIALKCNTFILNGVYYFLFIWTPLRTKMTPNYALWTVSNCKLLISFLDQPFCLFWFIDDIDMTWDITRQELNVLIKHATENIRFLDNISLNWDAIDSRIICIHLYCKPTDNH